MKSLSFIVCFLQLYVSYGQSCDTRLEYNKLLSKRQVVITPYIGLSKWFESYLALGFARLEDSTEQYILNTEMLFGDPYASNDQDSLVFHFKDDTKIKFVHEHTYNPRKQRVLHVFIYLCDHTFPVSAYALKVLATKPLRGVTMYLTGASGISFDHLPKRKQKTYGKRMGILMHEIKKVKGKNAREIQRRAACILQAKVPTVEQTMSR